MGTSQGTTNSLVTRIVDQLLSAAKEATVRDVRIGLGYTAVLFEDGRCGVAYTFREQAQGGCSVFRGIRPLAGRVASDLLTLVESSDVIEAAVGLACANALANRSREGSFRGDVLEHLGVRPDDDVAMIGNFGPLVGPIERSARSLTVCEQGDPSGTIRPAREAAQVLARSHIALITATSLINHTLDDLLEAARDCREVVLLGASTPMVPEIFEARVTMLSGVVVASPDQVLQVVSEGGGMRQFGPFVHKVSTKTRSAHPLSGEHREARGA